MFDTRTGNHLFFAGLALLIAGLLLTLRNEFSPLDQLDQNQVQVVGVNLSESGSGSVKVRSLGITKRFRFAWDIRDIFSDVKPNDSVELLTDNGWVVSMQHNGSLAIGYAEYIYRRSRTVFVIVAFAALTMVVNLVAFAVRSLGLFGPGFNKRTSSASGEPSVATEAAS